MARHESVLVATPSVKREHSDAAAPEHPQDGQEQEMLLRSALLAGVHAPAPANCSAELRHFLPALRGSRTGMFATKFNRTESQRI